MAKKKKGKRRGTSNNMTAAERTRAKMRAQEQAEAERQEAKARESEASDVPEESEARPVKDEVEDIDAQIAALERRRAELRGDEGASTKAPRPEGDEDEGGREPQRERRETYPGEAKLRRAQRKLERGAQSLDSNPTVNRIVCAVIDFFAGGVMLLCPVMLPYYYLAGTNTFGSLSDYLEIGQPSSLPIALAVVGLALGVFYYVVVPWKVWPGQTLGKHLGGIRFVRRDHRELDLWTIVLRQLVGVMFLELWLTCDCLLVPQLITLVTGSPDAGASFQGVGLVITVVSIVLFAMSKQRMPLHDRFAGTRVEHL